MLKFHGVQPIAPLPDLHPKGECPSCGSGTRFTLTTTLLPGSRLAGVKTFAASYACDLCLSPIAIEWTVNAWSDADVPLVRDPRLLTPLGLTLEMGSAPSAVRAPMAEALDCFRAGAFNGFAFLCWRAIEAMGDDTVGAGSPAPIIARLDDAMGLLGLADDWKSLLRRILTPPEGRSRAELPEINRERATVLLSVMRDLLYELYTRPARLKEAVRGVRGLVRETKRERRDLETREDSSRERLVGLK
ncbi:MAG: hypothetical protein M3S32_11635 [Acidobacteriota bacterium]|nr:hypothetical protein [Acidobacteriota bacterium]